MMISAKSSKSIITKTLKQQCKSSIFKSSSNNTNLLSSGLTEKQSIRTLTTLSSLFNSGSNKINSTCINNNNNNYSKYNQLNRYFSTANPPDQILRKVVTAEQQALFDRNAQLLEQLQNDLKDSSAPEESRQRIKDAIEQLKDGLFLLVVVGEFNSGKSSFLNALLGHPYLKEGITPTTSKINILKYGEKLESSPGRNDEQEIIKLPVNWLHDISLVDTPGTNAVVKGHQEITEHFIPRSDMVLFVTSVDRAFSESERVFLNNIRAWRKKIVVVLSKADLIEHNPMSDAAADLAEVTRFVQDNFNTLLGVSPVLFPVSSKLALKAKLTSAKSGEQLSNNELWKSSKFADLEKYILQTLDSSQRTKLKLLNPLGVAENILVSFSNELNERAKVLSVDQRTLSYVEEQLSAFRTELKKDLEFHLQRIDNILLKMETRADAFLDNHIKLSNMFALLRSEEMKLKFEKEVVASTTHEIETNISALIDWIVEKNGKQWRNLMDYIDTRSSSRLEKLIGNVNRSGDFLNSRKALLQTISDSTTATLSKYDKDAESTKISQEIRNTVFKTAAFEIGAVGLGTVLTASLLDLSGIVGVGILAIGGLALVPMKKATLKKSVHSKIHDLRYNLSNLLRHHFETELELGIQKMKDGISPFSSYVHLENEKILHSQNKIQHYTTTINKLKDDIEKLK